ncbi:ribokinase [Roseibium sediminicola]|uniref:Ribokinase n=1 Tax=Roseibium sediminicola TaxID=2933272 RepID=A0ABT0GSE2_9HYPH|nr:ribokinase [Roseibium sp. CAU 1639]MCK7611770.1 ribokinase [Roseibium sp. CAU 1639]
MKSVTVVGSINIDLTSYLDRWPNVGETIAVRETVSSLGGKGANQAVAAARLGARATFIGAVGTDGFAQQAAGELRREGVGALLAELAETATGLAFIDVGPEGGNMIRLAGGANHKLTPADIRAQADVLAACDVVLLQNEIGLETSLEAARLAHAAGALVIMDPAPAPVPAWPRDVLQNFDIITPNAHEAGGLLGWEPKMLDEGREAAKVLRDFCRIGAIVTLGEKGVAWELGDDVGSLPAPKVKAIDTVAAGDCFNGALATRLSLGESPKEAIAFAMRAAALATTRKGAASSLPTLEELEAPLKSLSA